jgi:hypothetical protein
MLHDMAWLMFTVVKIIILCAVFLVGLWFLFVGIPAIFVMVSEMAAIKRANPHFTRLDVQRCWCGFIRCDCVGLWGKARADCKVCSGKGWWQ